MFGRIFSVVAITAVMIAALAGLFAWQGQNSGEAPVTTGAGSVQ